MASPGWSSASTPAPGWPAWHPAQVDGSGGGEARVGWPFPTPLGAWVEAVGLGRLRRSTDFLIGSVLLLRAEALDEVGPFDERFFLYAEETDWQRRAATSAGGWPSAPRSPPSTSAPAPAAIPGPRGHFHASHERYMRKHHGPRGWQVYRAAVMTGAALRALVLPGRRGRDAADRFHLYRRGPCRVEAGR